VDIVKSWFLKVRRRLLDDLTAEQEAEALRLELALLRRNVGRLLLRCAEQLEMPGSINSLDGLTPASLRDIARQLMEETNNN
jgi:hypothetical protein